ncbi:AAA family ATPase [Okeania sp. SIO1I7]|uniref:protein kinase domain-containing protein n=1 Tax=Okeania sp. SIO1I7 TaxID=2607772 RepID=UPI0013F8243B|nr:AAA family ATPase [Okeania sp. SIO1I7]NET28492.1 AAA family ATPase [Okeania sp. SIO1I7]
MVTVIGYKNLVLIHYSDNSQVYRARRNDNNQPVILKVLAQEYPSTEEIRRYKQEYYLTSQLESPAIIKAYGLEECQRSYAIALEDFGGISLKQWLEEYQEVSLEEFLFLAIAITEGLAEIHKLHIIHKDINPANIVFNPKTKELKIIDFGISTQLSHENPTLKSANVLEGTLGYISPEQTGRMNRSLDYRTDFYSLGVTFYQMLAGKLPFESSDPLELVHCHLAKNPPSLIGEIPQVLADILIKLMAKNAEDRYQSAYGLKVDLEECRRQLQETGNIASFPLGQEDLSDRFSIPQKLYGREEEIATLLSAFERVSNPPQTPLSKGGEGRAELMMVAGYSGIGKSSLVRELYKPITARRGYFISGKFDQFQRNIPYSAIVSAFGGLIGQLLAETEAKLQIWREKLSKALGANGQVIIDVIPEVELIIGKQPSVPVLGGEEAQNRFNLVMGNFIDVFCDKQHPLTLFIDDLQWADSGTLKLIEQILIEGKTEYLLLLGAYRDNEVSASHPLSISLEKIQKNNNSINQITLQPLSLEQIACLIGDALHQSAEATTKLAQLVLEKTGGNPFFINEFLGVLSAENLLHFDRKLRNWQWNIEAIAGSGFTDNVVELMVKKLQKLPSSAQEILSIAACCGAEFDLQLMTLITGKSPQATFELLKKAIESDLILTRSELDENLLIQFYKFAHDRIQQAAYSMIPDDKKAATHYRIGKMLLQESRPEAIEKNIFDLVSQLNYGKALITEQKERNELAKLNLIACHQAKAATAYETAREYASMGLSMLGENAWDSQYEMTLALHDLATELAAFCGDSEAMERFAGIVIAKARTLLEKVNVYRIKMQFQISQNKYAEAIAIGQQILAELGMVFPATPVQEDLQRSIAEIETLIGERGIEDLVRLPKMRDREKIAITRIANTLIPAIIATGSSLFLLLVTLLVKLSIQYGNTEASGLTYTLYGYICCNIKQDVDTGVKYGKLALQVVSELDAKAFKAEALNVIVLCIWHRKYHLKETLSLSLEGYTSGLETGNKEFAGYCAGMYCIYSLWWARPLSTLEQEVRAYSNKFQQLNQLKTGNQCRIYWQTILNLLGVAENPTILSGEALSEVEFLSSNNDLPSFGLFYPYKLMLCYLFGEIESALNHAADSRRYVTTVAGMFFAAAFYFYDSLISLAALSLGLEERTEALQRVQENQTQLQQWAKDAPMNYQHKVDLVEAEKCRVLGQKAEAIELYNKAIAGAKENEYTQEEALANELAAKFYLNWGQEKVARLYMMDAHYCYSRWEATAKVKHLEENYPQLCPSPTTKSSGSTLHDTYTTKNSTERVDLDLATVIKSTNAISSEIVLDKLLATLMNILVENAGAQRGILILPSDEGLLVEAIKEADSEEVSVLVSLPLHKFEKLSERIVRYVARTRKTVVLNNATNEGKFTDDTYIQKYKCQSVACTPLISQNKLQGIIYLENNLSTGAFTQERLALLRTLAAQGAISLENARLYNKIITVNAAYERFVPAEFLSFLEKKSIIDVKLGDQVEQEMTVLFSDIRNFTTISEQMTPAENFAFINEYLGSMEPQIQKHGGFIDKYIGDAIMALFPNSADDALKGAIAMLQELKTYNSDRQQRNFKPISIGIGLHTGRLILGTVGGFGRMDGTVIGDAVNLSSRVEGLTKTYGVSLLITDKTWQNLKNSLVYDLRFIDKVRAKGKAKAVSLFEVFSADPPELRDVKIATKEKFERAVLLYHQGLFLEAAALFQECLEYAEGDQAVCCYLERCHQKAEGSGGVGG